jgi:hypothetical protein
VQNYLKNSLEPPVKVKLEEIYNKLQDKLNSKNLENKTINQNIGCPFSDHKFIASAINFPSIPSTQLSKITRNLNDENVKIIIEQINQLNFYSQNDLTNIEQKWEFLKNKLLDTIDQIAPLKTKKLQHHQKKRFPWVDDQLLDINRERNLAYASAIKSKCSNDWYK